MTKSTENNDKVWHIFRKGLKPNVISILPPWCETAPLPVNDNYPFFLASTVKCNQAGSNRRKFFESCGGKSNDVNRYRPSENRNQREN